MPDITNLRAYGPRANSQFSGLSVSWREILARGAPYGETREPKEARPFVGWPLRGGSELAEISGLQNGVHPNADERLGGAKKCNTYRFARIELRVVAFSSSCILATTINGGGRPEGADRGRRSPSVHILDLRRRHPQQSERKLGFSGALFKGTDLLRGRRAKARKICVPRISRMITDSMSSSQSGMRHRRQSMFGSYSEV